MLALLLINQILELKFRTSQVVGVGHLLVSHEDSNYLHH